MIRHRKAKKQNVFLIMAFANKDRRIDWVCRIIITLQVILVIRGYIAWLQTVYQLDSPLIPQSITHEISQPHIIASLITSGFMLITIWLYFFRKRIAAIIIGGISLFLSELWILLILK